jgi:ankyrin repeat protein
MNASDEPHRDTPDEDVVAFAGRMFDLARAGDEAQLCRYLDAGVSAGLTNDEGDSLVMLAAYHEHAGTVAALLARGADPNQSNDRGQTPLAGAVFKGADAVVRELLAAGADPTAGQPSAVETARMFGKAELLRLFGAA